MTLQAVEETERLSIPEEAELLTEIRRAMDILKDLASDAELIYKVRQQQLKDRMEAEKVDSIKVGGINYVPTDTTFAKVDDLSELVEWAEEHGHTEFLKIAANKETLNEEVRRRLDDGEILPPGVGFYVREYISQRAA